MSTPPVCPPTPSGGSAPWKQYSPPTTGPYILPPNIPLPGTAGNCGALYWELWCHGNMANYAVSKAAFYASAQNMSTPTPVAYWGVTQWQGQSWCLPSNYSAPWLDGMPVWFVNAMNTFTQSDLQNYADGIDKGWEAKMTIPGSSPPPPPPGSGPSPSPGPRSGPHRNSHPIVVDPLSPISRPPSGSSSSIWTPLNPGSTDSADWFSVLAFGGAAVVGLGLVAAHKASKQ